MERSLPEESLVERMGVARGDAELSHLRMQGVDEEVAAFRNEGAWDIKEQTSSRGKSGVSNGSCVNKVD